MNQLPRIFTRRKPWLAQISSIRSAAVASHSSDVLTRPSCFVPLHQLQVQCNYSSISRHHSYSSSTSGVGAYRLLGSSCDADYSSLLHNSTVSVQVRQFATKRKGKPKKDDNTPLLNEHLIAELLQMKKGAETADTSEVRLILDLGRRGKDDNDDDDDTSSEPSTPTTQIVTINKAISIAHDHSLDLMEVSLKGDPPVIKALDFEKFLYQQKRKESKTKATKSRDGGGSISDKPLKEFKFRAGIADHDLQRKASNMVKYLTKGHAVRVTLTARQRMLREDTDAINTTLERVKELVGDKAVEVRAMKSNERGSYGNLLMHPNIKK